METRLLNHVFVADGRPWVPFEDICVASGSGGMCGQPRSAHHTWQGITCQVNLF